MTRNLSQANWQLCWNAYNSLPPLRLRPLFLTAVLRWLEQALPYRDALVEVCADETDCLIDGEKRGRALSNRIRALSRFSQCRLPDNRTSTLAKMHAASFCIHACSAIRQGRFRGRLFYTAFDSVMDYAAIAFKMLTMHRLGVVYFQAEDAGPLPPAVQHDFTHAMQKLASSLTWPETYSWLVFADKFSALPKNHPAIEMSQLVYENLDFDLVPILCDALDDAGKGGLCDSLRSSWLCRGNWVLDFVRWHASENRVLKGWSIVGT